MTKTEHRSQSYEHQREQMVRTQLMRRGISDQRVLQAMGTVPRHLFVPEEVRQHAYADHALPLPDEQTISQPFIVALMAQALQLQPTDRVLDVGTGSGYAAAVLSLLSDKVYSIERSAILANAAELRLQDLGYTNVAVVLGDGTLGWTEAAPYDAIHVAAASPWLPRPLRAQLAEGGRLVIPVGGAQKQILLRAAKRDGETRVSHLGGVRFVPLIGEHGWGS